MSPTTRLALGITLTSILTAQAQRLPRATSTDAEEQERANPANQTMKPLARGTHYAVASMMQQATVTAEHVLSAGGNAFDAIVAGQAVLGIVQPASNGVGSDAVLLIYDAKAKHVWSLNAEGTAPRLATIDWYKKNQNGKLPTDDSLLAATVPGVIDAWYILLSRWGTRTFGELLQPAIELCEGGVPMGPALNNAKIQKYPTGKRLFAPPDGKRWAAGDVWKNPDLARTFRRLIEAEKEAAPNGREAGLKAARDRFYKGDIAREMARFSEENGGLFRYEDFATYAAKIEEPVFTNYRGYTVYKNASSNQGPAELFALNLLEGYDLKKMGLNSADYIHTQAEAIKLAMADRDTYLGDTDFIQIPYSRLLSKEYAAERRKLIDNAKASMEFRPGDAGEGFQRPRDVTTRGVGDHAGDTSYIAVVDRDRNMISFTPSLHSGFGAKIVMGNLGFIFNCRGDYYSLVEGHANALAPGKRPRSTLQGTLVMKDNQPFLVTGTPGGDNQAINTLQTLVNIVDFGMDIQEAIEAPRWTTRSFPASPFPHTMYPGDLSFENRIPASVKDELTRRGHKVEMKSPWSMNSSAGIMVDVQKGTLSAGADPRTSATALAW
jgi:gamma-glutamyltranspeptidase / glutathione hydrolase